MNLLNQFKKVIGGDQLLIGEVVSHNANGTSTVQLFSGAQVVARGQSVAVNSNAFVRGGIVEGAAPNLTPSTANV